jgi:hypothetical protein
MFPLPAPCSGPCWPPASSSACRCHLKAEHVALGWLSAFRIALLAAGCLGSAWLTFRLVFRSTAKKRPKIVGRRRHAAADRPDGLALDAGFLHLVTLSKTRGDA